MDKPIRIVTLLENNTYPDDVRVRPHMEALQSNGYHITVICPRGKYKSFKETINGVNVYRFTLPGIGIKTINYIWEFFYATIVMTLLTIWVWIRHGMDVLHIYNPPDTLFLAAILPKIAGKFVIYDLRDLAPELYQSKFDSYSSTMHNLLLLLEKLSCLIASYIIVVNESYRDLVARRDGIPKSRIGVVRQGPDLAKIYPTEKDTELRKRAKTIIGYLGAMSTQDGIDYLMDALNKLDKEFNQRDWYCVLIGSTDKLDELKKLSFDLGISNKVLFTGFLPYEKWLPLLSTVDIGVEPCPANPLNNLSTMNKIMDYMALGKPCVAFDLKEHHVTAGEAALYAKPNDTYDFANKIFNLIANPNLQTQLGMLGKKRVEQSLALSFQRDFLLSIYKSRVKEKLKASLD